MNGTNQDSDGDYWSDMDQSDSDDETQRNKTTPQKKKVIVEQP